MQSISGILLPHDKREWPLRLAKMFAEMDNEQQAEFFNELAIEAATWPRSHVFQWCDMQNFLTPKGKEIIDGMKDHTDP